MRKKAVHRPRCGRFANGQPGGDCSIDSQIDIVRCYRFAVAFKEFAESDANQIAVQALRDRILPLYWDNQRDLPWRKTRDPYGLVVAEFMLQQTGVDRVSGRWTQFLLRFPSWKSLSDASAGDVIREWQGLGYNRRALNLHRLATRVVQEFGGTLPDDRKTLLTLPGIGPYTVAAIQSFVFDLDEPSIDVNLIRVLARSVLGLEKAPVALIEPIARRSLPAGQSAHWNQALMDFAAIQCTLRRPRCMLCPLLDACAYARNGPPARSDQSIGMAIEPHMVIDRPYATGTASCERRVAEKPAAYAGSTRYFRGRIIDRLRSLASGESVCSTELKNGLLDHSGANSIDFERLLRDLAKEGMIVSDVFGRIRLP